MSPFHAALGPSFNTLDRALQRFHQGEATRVFRGRASVEHGGSALARAGIRMGGFPPVRQDRPFTITVTRQDDSEIWTRDFDGFITRSSLRYDAARGMIVERLDNVTCGLSLHLEDGGLHVGVARLWLMGLPVPQALLPRSRSREWENAEGAVCFDINAHLPGGGLMIRYHGKIRPAD